MTLEQALFYILAAVVLLGTILAITEKHPVHAIVYLVTSFFALAVIFYLLAAPVVAAFEVIIYAGAVMVLFLFVIMMLDLGGQGTGMPGRSPWLRALTLCGITVAAVMTLLARQKPLIATGSGPDIKTFALTLFRDYGVAIELISMQLLFAVVGALYLGRKRP